MHTNGLSFRTLREANRQRLPQFRDALGRLSHPIEPGRPPGFDWTAADWLQAVVGELGELANLLKKVRRGDTTQAAVQKEIENELADVQTYLDLLAYRLGVDLGAATVAKFNAVSERVGANVVIGYDDDWHQRRSTTPGPTPTIRDTEHGDRCETCGGDIRHCPCPTKGVLLT